MYDSWCKDLSKDVKESYDLSNHLKVPQTKRGKNKNATNNVKYFHARFSVLSALRSPIKLKLWNCSHRHHFEKNVHRGSMIEVIFLKIVLFCLVIVLYIVVYHHGSLIEVNMEKAQEHFLQLLKQIFFY